MFDVVVRGRGGEVRTVKAESLMSDPIDVELSSSSVEQICNTRQRERPVLVLFLPEAESSSVRSAGVNNKEKKEEAKVSREGARN